MAEMFSFELDKLVSIPILHNKKQLFERIQPFWINYLEAIIWKTTCQVEKHHIDSKVIANLDKQREAQ